MITLKSAAELALMRKAGRIVAATLARLGEALRPGISTLELDRLAEAYILSQEAVPSFKGYRGFPASICVSINDEVVHGIPQATRRLQEGDIVSIDLGVIYRGYHGDATLTFGLGKISDEAERLLQVTREALNRGIAAAQVGKRLGDIGHAIQSWVESHGYSVVRDLVGHGIGREMHEDPQVPNYGEPGRGLRLRAGMTLAIEPMVNVGTYEVGLRDDDWTVYTADHSLSAHFEHTVAITDEGPEILTRL